jgi:hypothetical protein
MPRLLSQRSVATVPVGHCCDNWFIFELMRPPIGDNVSAAPFPGFGGPGRPGFVSFSHGLGVFVPLGPRPGPYWHPGDVFLVLGATMATLVILDNLDDCF